MHEVFQTIEGHQGAFVHEDRQTIGFTPFTKPIYWLLELSAVRYHTNYIKKSL